MKHPILFVAILGLAGSIALAQHTIYVSPDVPTDPDPGPPASYLPWDVVEHVHASPTPYALELTVPGNPVIDALAKMDEPGNWLFSVDAPNDLAGALPNPAQPRDVIRLGAAGYGLFFEGSCVGGPGGSVPTGSNVDAIYVEGEDNSGDLVVSFDVPTTILGTTFQPSELVRWVRSAGPPCGWQLGGSVIDFAKIAVPGFTYYPASANIVGADFAANQWIVALDIPVDLAPPPGPTTEPGRIVATDGSTGWILFDDLQSEGVPGWPIRSQVDALTCQSNPGRIESPLTQILMGKSLPQIYIACPASCSAGAERYGVYAGTIASLRAGVYDHKRATCSATCPGNFNFVPAATSSYYLVVPYNTGCNAKEEGSYNTDSNGAQRPQPALVTDRCAAVQNLTPCP